MAYDVSAIRNKLMRQMSGKVVDPDEFRPPKAESSTEATKYRFYILPPFSAGDKVKGGEAKDSMEHFFIPHANHWINDKPYPCPRVWDTSHCEICQTGFDLLKEEKGEEARKNIIKTWMPNTYYMVNIFFTNSKMNPEDLRGKVKFFNAPKTCFDIWSSTLMKDDAGDSEDPEAYGVFFDENAAFMFQLEVLKHGRNNSYKTSHFVANGGKPTPMLPEKEKLEKLLRLRHNLFDKITKPDQAAIAKLARTLLDGDDDDSSAGFDQDESKPKTSVTTESKASKSKPRVETVDDDDDVDDVVGDDLVDESPIDDADDDDEPAPKPPKSKPAKPVAVEVSDDGDDEIDALLDQLED